MLFPSAKIKYHENSSDNHASNSKLLPPVPVRRFIFVALEYARYDATGVGVGVVFPVNVVLDVVLDFLVCLFGLLIAFVK